MDLEKSLNLLGLNKNFTKEELNKAYKENLKTYHPDLYENKTYEEKIFALNMTKNLNYARSVLIDYLNNNNNNNKKSNNSDELNYYKKPEIDRLNNIKHEIGNISALNNEIFNYICIEFRFIINEYIDKINNSNTITDIFIYKEEFKFKYITFISEYKDIFYKVHNIPYNYMASTINFKDPIKEVTLSLEKVKESYLNIEKYKKRKMKVLFNICHNSNDYKLISLYRRYEKYNDASTLQELKEILINSSLGKEALLYIEIIDKFSKDLNDKELMDKIDYIFDLYESNLIDIEKLMILHSINFNNKELDNYKLDIILNNIKTNVKTRSHYE